MALLTKVVVVAARAAFGLGLGDRSVVFDEGEIVGHGGPGRVGFWDQRRRTEAIVGAQDQTTRRLGGMTALAAATRLPSIVASEAVLFAWELLGGSEADSAEVPMALFTARAALQVSLVIEVEVGRGDPGGLGNSGSFAASVAELTAGGLPGRKRVLLAMALVTLLTSGQVVVRAMTTLAKVTMALFTVDAASEVSSMIEAQR